MILIVYSFDRILYDKRFSVFHYPVTDEDAPNYHSIVQNPMDMATLLQRVDCGQYLTCSSFFQDVDLIVANAKAYNGNDYTGSRIVSRAYELRDAVQGMLSQMDPALVTFCDKIAAQGGPVSLPDDMRDLLFPPVPVVQQVAGTRTSARLRHVQPEVNLSQSYEALKRPKKNSDADQTGTNSDQTLEDKYQTADEPDLLNLESSHPQPPVEPHSNGAIKELENNPVDEIPESSADPCPVLSESIQDSIMTDCHDMSEEISSVKKRLIERTEGYGIPQLERLYTRVVRGVIGDKSREVGEDHKSSILRFLLKFADDGADF